MEHLRINADQAFDTSHAVGNDAEELREELAGLQRDWDNLSTSGPELRRLHIPPSGRSGYRAPTHSKR